MQVRLKDIKNYPAVDITAADPAIVYEIAAGRRTVAISYGTYGANGIVVYNDRTGQFYKIVGRTSNLFILL